MTIVAKSMLHGTYVHDNGRGADAIVVSEIVEDENGKTRPNLRVFKSPTVPVWITQPGYRTHPDKKEIEELKVLDVYHVSYKNKDTEIFKALNGHHPNFLSPKMRRETYKSPYLYGANITIEALVASRYKKELLQAGKTPHSPTTGFFDIEMSLLKDSYGELPLLVFTAENQVFLAMKKGFMTEKFGAGRIDVTIEKVKAAAHEHIDSLVESIFAENDGLSEQRGKMPFQYHFYVGDTEVDLIRWIFGKMHESKTSFIGIWNLGFDIGQIIKILEKNKIPLEEIFADPALLNSGFAYASYREDNRQVAHITQKWHWLSATAHFQFIDSMALYSYIRMVDGKEASYALDDILKKFGLGGKLKIEATQELAHLQTEDWHREMLSNYFTYYACYAMWDGMALQLLEWLNQDLTAMRHLCDITPPKFFVNQTIRVTNTLFEDWLPKGFVLGTGVDVEGLRDDDLLDGGGAVLEPQNLVARGLKLFKEWINHATNCFSWVSDLDFSALYPTLMAALNISRSTKVGTMLSIVAPWLNKKYPPKEAVEIFSSYLISPAANGVELGVDFFDLPDYDEMNQLFVERCL